MGSMFVGCLSRRRLLGGTACVYAAKRSQECQDMIIDGRHCGLTRGMSAGPQERLQLLQPFPHTRGPAQMALRHVQSDGSVYVQVLCCWHSAHSGIHHCHRSRAIEQVLCDTHGLADPWCDD
jgi:hypothetical protein